MRRGRVLSVMLAAVLGGAASFAGAGAASAATGSGYGAWTVEGARNAFSGTVTLPTGFSAVSFTSDSSAAAIPTSATQPATSSFGSVFGASTGQQYINLRPSGGAGTTSTTVYTFATPTPADTWGIALGDIDAEALTISATDAAGAAVSSADLGFQTAENSGSGPDTLTATESATGYLVEDVQCPTVEPDRCDTQGATAWFRPAVPLSTLTVSSTFKSGFPIYQTWFATLVRAVSGTVTVPADVVLTEPVTLSLTDSSGTVLETTTAAADGSYLFDTLAARDDYTVAVGELSLPDGVTTTDPVDADTIVADITDADFGLAAPVPTGAIAGTVVDPDGEPVPDAEVTVSGDPTVPDPIEETTATDERGAFAVDDLPFGDYTIAVVPPAASGLVPSTVDATVDADTSPVEVTLEAQTDDLTGTVVDAAGDPVPDVEVTVSGDPIVGGPVEETTVTGADGAFEIDGLRFGDYLAEVVPPESSGLAPTTVPVSIGSDAAPLAVVLDAVDGPGPGIDPPGPGTDPPGPGAGPSAPGSPPVVSDPGGSLAATGHDALPWTAAGLLFLLAGGVLAIRGRGRRAER